MTGDQRLRPGYSVDSLKGVGVARSRLLAAHGIHTLGDLLFHLPLRWEDRRRWVLVEEIEESGSSVAVRGRIMGVFSRRARRRFLTILEGVFEDSSGRMPIIWFNSRGLETRLQQAKTVVLYGVARAAPKGGLQLVNPEVEAMDQGDRWVGALVPVYPILGTIGGPFLRRLICSAMPALDDLRDPLPEAVRRQLDLPDLRTALRDLHRPAPDIDDRAVAALASRRSPSHLRLAFDELLAFSLGLAQLRGRRRMAPGPCCGVDDVIRRRAVSMLPFQLTGAQRRVLGEIAADLEAGPPMARLVQGDVGSGKTVVAALAMLIALENNHQVVMMAPTELLAVQHQAGLERLFQGTPWTPELLSGSVGTARRREILAGLADATCPFVVGTHALIQDAVSLANLGMVVIDEQHRFGTVQRRALVGKGVSPHLLVMTATPIPRSLALTLYGDLDLSVIDEMPPGRQPIRTEIRDDGARERLNQFLRWEVEQGGRVFVVYPLIEASESIDARAVTEYAEEMRLALPGLRVEVLHGRMDPSDRDAVLQGFRSGEVQVILATTVIEVGIDVPEATVMVIESAERFGLSQLHQLRGRVGRGDRQSWCVVMVGAGASEAARRRLARFADTPDGFALAEADLEMRGPGELMGIRQWGPSHFRFADLLIHHDLAVRARATARDLNNDGELPVVAEALSRYHRTEVEFSAG